MLEVSKIARSCTRFSITSSLGGLSTVGDRARRIHAAGAGEKTTPSVGASMRTRVTGCPKAGQRRKRKPYRIPRKPQTLTDWNHETFKQILAPPRTIPLGEDDFYQEREVGRCDRGIARPSRSSTICRGLLPVGTLITPWLSRPPLFVALDGYQPRRILQYNRSSTPISSISSEPTAKSINPYYNGLFL